MEKKEANNDITSQPEILSTQKKKKNRSKNKRRFSDEQIKLLESMFKSDTKLDPNKKVQLARELGLQPRQVAIWFQNKRARWRSKQIEQDYKILSAKYENLASQFESLKKERQSLLRQLQELNDQLEENSDMNKENKGLELYSIVGNSDMGALGCETKGMPSYSSEPDQTALLLSHEHDSRDNCYAGDDKHEYLNESDSVNCSLATPEIWCSFDSGSVFGWWNYLT